MNMTEFLKRWHSEQYGHMKARTYHRYAEIVDNNILPILGNVNLSDLTVKDIKDFISYLNGRYSDNTVLQIVGVLKRALNLAIIENIIAVNPATGITLHHNQRKIEPFNEHERRLIVDYILKNRNPYYYGILLALYTGVRIGELLALTWEDVDMKCKTIRVNKTAGIIKIANGENPFVSTPKTAAGVRTIPYPKQLDPLLKEMKALNKSHVVCTRKGNYMTVYGYQKTFSRMLERLGIKHKGFHSLRHTYATHAIEVGADIKTLSEMLGHSSPTVTIARYCHSTEKQKSKLCEKIGDDLKRYTY